MEKKTLIDEWRKTRGRRLTDGITSRPRDEVGSHNNGLLGLTGNVSSDHRHAQGLRSPETEDHVVGDEEADLGSLVLILDSHQYSGADERSNSRYDVSSLIYCSGR